MNNLNKILLLTVAVFGLMADFSLVAMEEIIGSWRKADKSIVEFRPEGEVIAAEAQIGTWKKLADSRQYNVFINGTNGYYFKAWVSHYQRKLTMKKSNGTGTETVIDRIDNGPTVNPEVPDEKGAMELEFTELENSIEDAYVRLAKVQAEAAEARQRHEYARALGRVSAHLITAQQREAAARGIESSIKNQKRRLAILEKTLGKKARIIEPVPVQPVYPTGIYPPGVYPPGVYPPGFVPGGPFMPIR